MVSIVVVGASYVFEGARVWDSSVSYSIILWLVAGSGECGECR